MRGSLVLTAYRRPLLFRRCLESILGCQDVESVSKILIVQPGNAQTESMVQELVPEDWLVVHSPLRVRTPGEAIFEQVWRGLTLAFTDPSVDWVLKVEEDSELSPLALAFVSNMHDRYKRDRAYRGINLGSVEDDPSLSYSYSRLRFGLHGMGGVVTRRTWKFANVVKPWRQASDGFDSLVEAHLKTGFVVTPNLSLVVNNGWYGGTHVRGDTESGHFFRKLAASSAAHRKSVNGIWRHQDVSHSWRADVRVFRHRDFPRYAASALSRYGRMQLSHLRKADRGIGSFN